MNDVLQLKEAVALFQKLLAEGRTIPVRYTGTSMNPFLREGDWMEVRRATPESVAVGKLVLFENGGELTVHRVCHRSKRNGAVWVSTRGDASIWIDPPRPVGALLGVVQKPAQPRWRAYWKARYLLFLSLAHYVKMRLLSKRKR